MKNPSPGPPSAVTTPPSGTFASFIESATDCNSIASNPSKSGTRLSVSMEDTDSDLLSRSIARCSNCDQKVVFGPKTTSDGAILVTSADADQLLVDELVCAVAAEFAAEAGALRAPEGQFRAVCADDVHVDHAGVDPICDALGLLRVVRHQIGAESERGVVRQRDRLVLRL